MVELSPFKWFIKKENVVTEIKPAIKEVKLKRTKCRNQIRYS